MTINKKGQIEMTNCPDCKEPMPKARLTIEIARGVCAECNKNRPQPLYAQPCYGFKNNGASVVPADQIRAHAEGVKVVG